MFIACTGVLQREGHSLRATQYLTSSVKEHLQLSLVENTCGVNSGRSKAAHSGVNLLNAGDDCGGVIFGCCSCIYAPEAGLLRQNYSSHNDCVSAVRKYSSIFIRVQDRQRRQYQLKRP